MSGDAVDSLVLAITRGVAGTDLEEAARRLVSERQVARTVAAARRAITRAADFARDEELGKAITRGHEIYRLALESGDLKTALAAQRETNRLLGLHEAAAASGSVGSTAEDAGDIRAELEAIGSHLRPLGLAPDTYPLAEVARIAADLLRDRGVA